MAKQEGVKILADNRRARYKYKFLETHEAGIVLSGPEVKSARAGKVQLLDAYASIHNNELWLHNAHISPYLEANRWNHEPTAVRKLLMHRREIDRLIGKTRESGLTMIPAKMYLKNGKIKIELALAQGKQEHDKRETIKKRETDREMRQALMRRR